jgi:hypothetical protein
VPFTCMADPVSRLKTPTMAPSELRSASGSSTPVILLFRSADCGWEYAACGAAECMSAYLDFPSGLALGPMIVRK